MKKEFSFGAMFKIYHVLSNVSEQAKKWCMNMNYVDDDKARKGLAKDMTTNWEV